MLESEAHLQLERSDAESLIAWSETGKAFRIEDVTLFSTLVLPKYFRTNKFSSFQRNLNLVSIHFFTSCIDFVRTCRGDSDVTNPINHIDNVRIGVG